MRKYFSKFLAIVVLLIFQHSFAAEQRVVKVGAFDYYPGIFQDKDGIVKGFYIDALSEISEKENIHFEYVFGSWSDGLDRLKSGQVDILTSVAYTDERALFMDYCKTPLLTVWGELYTLRSSEIDDILEIHNKKIGIMKSDYNARHFIDLTSKFDIKCDFVEYASFEDVFKAISSKKVDAGVASVTYGAAKQTEFGLRSTGVIFNPFNIYFTTGKGKNQDLLMLLDKYLNEWRHSENSVFNKARQKWSHGTVGSITVIPDWMNKAFIIIGVIFLVVLIFIILLKLQVKRATVKVVQRESEIKIKKNELEVLNEELNSTLEEMEAANEELITTSESLRKSEGHMRALLQTIPDLIWLKDKDGVYLSCNAMFERFFGASEQDIIGKTDYDFMGKSLAEFFRANDRRAMEAGKPARNEESITFADDGHIAQLDTIKIPMYDERGELTGVLGIGRDITENKKSEEKIKSLLMEKELLLKEVHHRIKNNMNTIKGLLTLQLSAEQNTSAAASLRDAESRVQSMIMLYDRLYTTENYRELPVKEYLQRLADEIIGSFTNSSVVRIKTEIDDFILNVQKLTPLGIIVNEILTNAMKYAFTGRESGVITLSASMKDNRANIVIQDDGVGIPESMSFEKTSGFGLDLVGMLMEQIDGSIKIERDDGTRFVIEFEV